MIVKIKIIIVEVENILEEITLKGKKITEMKIIILTMTTEIMLL